MKSRNWYLLFHLFGGGMVNDDSIFIVFRQNRWTRASAPADYISAASSTRLCGANHAPMTMPSSGSSLPESRTPTLRRSSATAPFKSFLSMVFLPSNHHWHSIFSCVLSNAIEVPHRRRSGLLDILMRSRSSPRPNPSGSLSSSPSG